MSFRIVFVMACALLPAASGQALQSFILAMGGGTVQVQVPPNGVRVVTGAPFSAVETQELERMLPDGSRRMDTLPPHRIYRDALGRTRIEQGTLVEINDPGAGVYYLLDTQGQIAYAVKSSPPRAPRPNAGVNFTPMPTVGVTLITPGGPAGGGPVPAIESIGRKTMQGVEAEGKRSTVVTGVNPARPEEVLSRVTETWTSVLLQITLLTTVTDVRSGNSKFEVMELSREAPAPVLFQPPPGFKIVDQQPFFAIELK